ncbi:hypothetical protein JCM10212_004014 [Sporobolomyces blumeae]
MPSKRRVEDAGRPPLARGSACHRCFTRKVRCSGQPDPETGMHACHSCSRTAKFKGHDLAQVRCAFNGEGLCSEEGGPTMNGDVLPPSNGPVRRRFGPRSYTSSSRSTSSKSVASSNRSSSFASLSSISSTSSSPSSSSTGSETVSPATSVESVPTLEKLSIDASTRAPPSRAPIGVPQDFLPPPVHFTTLSESAIPPPFDLSTTLPAMPSAPAPVQPPLRSQSSLLARRSNAPALQIVLPRSNYASPSSSFATLSSADPSLNSASWPTPADWHAPPPAPVPSCSATGFSIPPPQVQVPHSHLVLDLAPYSALTPSSLSKFNAASVPSFDFALPRQPAVTFDPYVPSTISDALGLGNDLVYPQTTYPAFSQPTPCYPLAAETDFFPRPVTVAKPVDAFTLDDPAVASFDPLAYGASFVLPSPGLTFSSSTPYWYSNAQYFAP